MKTIGDTAGISGGSGRRRNRRILGGGTWYCCPPLFISHEPEPGVLAVLGGRLVGGGELRARRRRHGQRRCRRAEGHTANAAGGVAAQENLQKFSN